MRLTSDHIAIKPLKKAERAVGSIILPATAQAPFMMWGEVIAVGPGHRGNVSKALWPVTVKKGDRVLYPSGAARLSYEHLRIDGVHYDVVVFVQERDAGLVIRDGAILPLYRRVIGHIVEEPVEEEITPAGLILPVHLTKQRSTDNSTSYVRVQIDHVGFGARADNGTAIPNTLSPGDIAIVDKFDAWEYELLEGDALTGHVILDEDQVLALDDDYVPPSSSYTYRSSLTRGHRASVDSAEQGRSYSLLCAVV